MDAVQPKSKSGGPGYAWVIVFAAFLCFGVVFGSVLYSFTVFVNPVAEAFKVDKTQVVLAFTLLNVGSGILGIGAGRLLQRFPIRWVIVGGLLLLAAGFFGISLATSLIQFYLLYGIIIAFSSAMVAPLGASAIVSNWFATNRGRALTLATLGTSFGQLIIPKAAAAIMVTDGWQGAYRAFAILMLIVAVPIAFIVVDRPEHKGLKAYGAGDGPAPPVQAGHELLSNGQILRRPDFWVIAISYLTTVVVYLGVTATIVPYARTFGVTPLQAANMVLCMGIFGIIGKIGFAAWTDRIGLRNTFWIAIALNLVALILLTTVQGYNVLFVASALVGGSAGAVLPVWPGFVAFRFGPRALPQVMGLMSPMVLSLQGFGAPVITGMNFRPAYFILMGLLVVSALLSRNLSKPAAPLIPA
jgi:MFS family permease